MANYAEYEQLNTLMQAVASAIGSGGGSSSLEVYNATYSTTLQTIMQYMIANNKTVAFIPQLMITASNMPTFQFGAFRTEASEDGDNSLIKFIYNNTKYGIKMTWKNAVYILNSTLTLTKKTSAGLYTFQLVPGQLKMSQDMPMNCSVSLIDDDTGASIISYVSPSNCYATSWGDMEHVYNDFNDFFFGYRYYANFRTNADGSSTSYGIRFYKYWEDSNFNLEFAREMIKKVCFIGGGFSLHNNMWVAGSELTTFSEDLFNPQTDTMEPYLIRNSSITSMSDYDFSSNTYAGEYIDASKVAILGGSYSSTLLTGYPILLG